ncbi:hypothetical protein K435DRAFT_802764 [Dendrothele bispora CBS 962.96]|uniref:Uncharacterized protein n=1 Tax=Dendrothele bispora (strain CBS 962.96) TaxID=1314807 RepID=A0A4S8LJQ9_DENBC|nr:hypothetical protein K435DRAFT_802764 [Dendrothele bispora CBS 962.96]
MGNPLTCLSATIKNLQDKIDASAACYWSARAALLVLGPRLGKVGWENGVKELKPDDVRGLSESHFDDKNAEKLEMSWIWRTEGINPNGEEEMHDALRIAWCKTRARAHHYQEECILLQEEIRRIKETYKYEVNMWAARGSVSQVKDSSGGVVHFLDNSPEAVEGRRAYAGYQMFPTTQGTGEAGTGTGDNFMAHTNPVSREAGYGVNLQYL